MYTSGKRTHIFDSSLTHTRLSTVHSLARTHSHRTCASPANGSILFLGRSALIACAIYIKTKMKIHCVYTPHSIFMCKYLRALFVLSCPISFTFFNLCCCFSFYYIFFFSISERSCCCCCCSRYCCCWCYVFVEAAAASFTVFFLLFFFFHLFHRVSLWL